MDAGAAEGVFGEVLSGEEGEGWGVSLVGWVDGDELVGGARLGWLMSYLAAMLAA